MRGWQLAVLLSVAACGSGDPLDQGIPCSGDGNCAAGYSCLVNQCVADGSLGDQETCNHEEQCAAGLTCVDFACTRGCSRPYSTEDCEAGLWCKPAAELGECVSSECDPGSPWCDTGVACVALGPDVGACLGYCEYGFASDIYRDNCTDGSADLACQPMGINAVPICLPSGGAQVGTAGCDPIDTPCAAGAICVDVVCRRLCRESQSNACDVGESCVSLGSRNDVFYCRAN